LDKAAAEKAAADRVAAEKAAADRVAADRVAADEVGKQLPHDPNPHTAQTPTWLSLSLLPCRLASSWFHATPLLLAASGSTAHNHRPTPRSPLSPIPSPRPSPSSLSPHLQMRQQVKAMGLLPVLESLKLDSDETIAAAVSWCGENGAESVAHIVQTGFVDDFVSALRLKSIPGRRLKAALQPLDSLASQLSRRGERPASSRPQVRGSPLCSGSTAAVTTVVAHGARWQCALTGFLPPLVTA
jgi:hypothetical protein